MADQQVRLSVPILQSTYERSFEAEIDALNGNEILVRGRMHDHRFDLVHIWRLRTPEFELLEASAHQKAGEQSRFNPELCRRYPDIRGARIGRGLSKRIRIQLGDLPGAEEHLFLAIEMARVGQQVVQLPPGFEARFASSQSLGANSAAFNFWRTDRAYMPELAGSCYTYRDASAALFASREVRMGFSADLYSPRPGDKRIFWREKQLSVSVKRDSAGYDFYACKSWMNDTVHDIAIMFDLAPDGTISNANSRGLRLPYHGICEDAQLRGTIERTAAERQIFSPTCRLRRRSGRLRPSVRSFRRSSAFVQVMRRVQVGLFDNSRRLHSVMCSSRCHYFILHN